MPSSHSPSSTTPLYLSTVTAGDLQGAFAVVFAAGIVATGLRDVAARILAAFPEADTQRQLALACRVLGLVRLLHTPRGRGIPRSMESSGLKKCFVVGAIAPCRHDAWFDDGQFWPAYERA